MDKQYKKNPVVCIAPFCFPPFYKMKFMNDQ